MKKHHYQCKTCCHMFDTAKIITGRNGSKYERCPSCGSWNYYLTNLSVITTDDDSVHLVEYKSPSLYMTLFKSLDRTKARRVYNRIINLKWDVFQSIISGCPPYEARLYLDDQPCLMNGFMPWFVQHEGECVNG